jgi:hypothetical protein
MGFAAQRFRLLGDEGFAGCERAHRAGGRAQCFQDLNYIAPHASYRPHLVVQRAQFIFSHHDRLPHPGAVHHRVRQTRRRAMEIEKFFYFFERKAQLLRQPYTLHGVDVLLRVGAVSGRGTQSRLEQFSPLIKSDCPDFDARSLRQFSNLHAVSINSAPRYRLKKENEQGLGSSTTGANRVVRVYTWKCQWRLPENG